MEEKERVTYESAGVNIAAGEDTVQRIKTMVDATRSSAVLSGLGLFGGFFEIDIKKYSHPVLVSSIDGVGTKLKVAFAMGVHDTIGEDLVNHCVNDIMTSGADPLFFLDYLGTGALSPQVVEKIVEGMARGCKNASCALIGGETAEMPGFYQKGEYDVAGAIVGVIEKNKIVDGRKIKKGDILIGLPSNGLHTNGYSLARKVLFEIAKYKVGDYVDDLNQTIGEALLQVHTSYQKAIALVRDIEGLHGISHITGGGIVGNTKRLLSSDLSLNINWNGWEVPPVFQLIQRHGNISNEEMQKVFNLGIGLVFVIKSDNVSEVENALNQASFYPIHVGEIR